MRGRGAGGRAVDWVAGLMVVFVVGVLTFALLPSSLWNGRSPVGGGATLPAGTAPGGVWAGATLGAVGVVPPQALPVAGRTTLAQPGMVPFEQAPKVKFGGRIQQITELQQRDGQIHIWVHGPGGVEQQISVAPGWFLEYMGCQLTHDLALTGLGFQFDHQGPDPLIYAQKIVVNGRNCRLRNDEGFALWSNRLR